MMTANRNVSIRAKQIVSYDIALCSTTAETIARIVDHSSGHRLIFVDEGLPPQHRDEFLNQLTAAGVTFTVRSVPGDEENKTLPNVLDVVKAMNECGVKRRSAPSIVIGGGVALDIVGFAASLYRRGVPYIRVPTTLLSMVDVSVAAKTAANHLGYRNRIGTFHPASLTLVNMDYLGTLPRRHVANGSGEIFKLAVIKDAKLFDLIEAYSFSLAKSPDDIFEREKEAIGEIIFRSIAGMAEELEPNLWEGNLERVVDYGHTFSPLVEMTHIAELLHGEAVALDCLFSAIISYHRGTLSRRALERLFQVAYRLDLPVFHHGFQNIALLIDAIADSAIHRDGKQNAPLMSGIGSAYFVNDIDETEIMRAAEAMKRIHEQRLHEKTDLVGGV
ncbi:sedoheptulose 7-phosphate cyclase [Asaia spathodeae]|uniref:Sedoheptulose 7-phosphate cyclase n=1 Tax=Asaia spathodeae TaxID=657016 RepID=A0ABX2P8C4_9PROT|nr:sedoheptulose 7-phosphate cyclase [Asaia spathodeae]GBR19047.1 putative shikimate kinase [Asaia spathodeae NBRC 105894]